MYTYSVCLREREREITFSALLDFAEAPLQFPFDFSMTPRLDIPIWVPKKTRLERNLCIYELNSIYILLQTAILEVPESGSIEVQNNQC